MKKVFRGLAALVVVLIVTAAVAPSLIDWTSYRHDVAAEIARALGRRVVIDGPVDVSILPSPRLSLHGARLGNPEGALLPLMAQVEALEVRLALWPLLTGRIVATSVFLHKPIIELERLADGRGNWQFTAARSGNDGVGRNPIVEGVQFENAVIDDGTIIYRDARSGIVERVEGVNARFAADGIYGPLRLAGELRYDSVPLRFSVSTGRLDPTGQAATPLNVTAEVRGAAQGLMRIQPVLGSGVLNAAFRLSEAGLLLGGKMRFGGDDLADLIAAFGPRAGVPGFLAQPFHLDGVIDLKDDSLTANGMSLQFGETRAEGAVSAAFGGAAPQFDIALTLGRIDLDVWRVAAAKKAATPKSVVDKLAAGGATDFILPSNIRMTLDVGVDAVTYRGGAARQAHLAAEMSDGVIDIHQFEVQLPGSTNAVFSGKLLASEGHARLDGQAELMSDDFRTLLGWFDVDITDMPAGRLNKVSALSQLSLTRETLDLGDIDLRFDNTRLTGAMVTALRDRPAFGANLIVDRLNLDAYFPPEFAAAPSAASQAAGGAIPLSILTEFDANLRLLVGQFDKGNATGRNAMLDGTLIDGVLTINELAIADLAGGGMTLAGKLDGFRDRLRLNLEFDIDAEEPADLLRLVGVALPLPDAAIKPLAVHGRIVGDDTAYKIDGGVNAAALALSLNGDLALPRNAPPQFALDMGIAHPDFIDLLRLFDPDIAPERQASARAVNLNGRIASQGRDYSLSALGGRFGPLTLEGGSASLALEGALPRVTAQLSAGDIDTRYFLAPPRKPPARAADGERWSTAPIDLDVARMIDGRFTISGKSLRHGKWVIDEPNAEFSLADGGLDLKRLAGRMMGGEFALQGRLAPRDSGDPVMGLDYNFSLSGADLSQALFDSPGIDLSGGRIDVAMEGRGVGTSEAALLAAMNGKGTILLENTQLKGFDLTRLNARFAATENPGELARLIQSTLSSGSTRVTRLDGDFTIADGVVAFDDLRVKSAAGEARALIAADLPQWRLDATVDIRLAAQARAPKIEMQMSGPLDAPKREFESLALQSYLLDEKARGAPARPMPQNAPARPIRPSPQSSPVSP